MKDTDILLVSVYGLNRDTPAFYEELTEMVKEYQNHNIIIVGDWNLVLDPQLDSYNYKHINNPKAKESVENMMLELGLLTFGEKLILIANVIRGEKRNHLSKVGLIIFYSLTT